MDYNGTDPDNLNCPHCRQSYNQDIPSLQTVILTAGIPPPQPTIVQTGSEQDSDPDISPTDPPTDPGDEGTDPSIIRMDVDASADNPPGTTAYNIPVPEDEDMYNPQSAGVEQFTAPTTPQDPTPLPNQPTTHSAHEHSITGASIEGCQQRCGVAHGTQLDKCTNICTYNDVHGTIFKCVFICDSVTYESDAYKRGQQPSGRSYPIGSLYDGEAWILPCAPLGQSWEATPTEGVWVLVDYDFRNEGMYTEETKLKIRDVVHRTLQSTNEDFIPKEEEGRITITNMEPAKRASRNAARDAAAASTQSTQNIPTAAEPQQEPTTPAVAADAAAAEMDVDTTAMDTLD